MMKRAMLKVSLPALGRSALVLVLTVSLCWSWSSFLLASEPCEAAGQVISKDVCDFDHFYGSPPRQLPVGWTAFILAGDLTYMQDVDTFWGAPALRMWSNGGTFKAGIYTQVQVTPGAGYRASISWGGPNAPDNFGRQLGLDPTGGTDPNAPTVIWGPMHFGPGRILNYTDGGPNIDVRARAVGDTMTVFFLVDHPTSGGDELIFVDVIGLYQDESAPVIEPPTPTPAPTEAPVAAARIEAPPAPVLPTATWTPAPTDTPTVTPTPTETPTPTATPSPTPSPTPTASPTWTPWPTATDDAPEVLNSSAASPALLQAATTLAHQGGRTNLLMVGLLGLGGAGACGSSLWWLRRRR